MLEILGVKRIDKWIDSLVDSGVLSKMIFENELYSRHWISEHHQLLGEDIFRHKNKFMLKEEDLVKYFCNLVMYNTHKLKEISTLMYHGLHMEVEQVLKNRYDILLTGCTTIRLGDVEITEVRALYTSKHKIESRIEIRKNIELIEKTKEIGLKENKVYTRNYVIHKDGRVTKNTLKRLKGVKIVG